ncbi:MAG: hypothetical protein ACRYFY_19335, partial [Janthinobacterium lividum]
MPASPVPRTAGLTFGTTKSVHLPLLTILTFLPLIGALAMLAIRGNAAFVERTSRWVAFGTSLLVLVLSAILWIRFVPRQPGFQFEDHADWVPGFGISYHLGLDGISLLFVVLTAAITPVSILASWNVGLSRIRDYLIALLLLETTLIGLFSSLDFVLFYVFYEATLIPGS